MGVAGIIALLGAACFRAKIIGAGQVVSGHMSLVPGDMWGQLGT